jgi:acylphosphatase
MATRVPVTGFVRNLPDGTVELLVQGRTTDISSLLADVASHFHRHIRECQRTTIVSPEVFQSFDIRF